MYTHFLGAAPNKLRCIQNLVDDGDFFIYFDTWIGLKIKSPGWQEVKSCLDSADDPLCTFDSARVIDFMSRHSEWALPDAKTIRWKQDVLEGDKDGFFTRAGSFLARPFGPAHPESSGAFILNKVCFYLI